MPRIVHFEIPAKDPEKTAKFYERVFGWKIMKWDGPMDYWLVTTGKDNEPGINGGITRKSAPVTVTTNTIGVPSVDDYVKKIIKEGGKVIAPKMEVMGQGWLAYCQDVEGNVFGVMQSTMQPK
jgi:predicted enzyme related to lactoylglutathione lyase